MALLETPQNIIEGFYRSRRSKVTLKICRYQISRVLPDPEAFLVLADSNKWKAQQQIIDWIVANRNLKPITCRTYLDGVRSLCNYAEVTLSWQKILAACPPKAHPKDESPPREAIRKIYSMADLRMKFLIHIFLGAPRVGAFEYFKVKDLKPFLVGDVEIGLLKVYAGEPEEYYTFLTPEGLAVFREYIEFRKRMGEDVQPDSPLVRNVFNPKALVPSVKPLKPHSVQELFRDAWERAGYKRGENRNWKVCHSFRKFLKTELEDTEMKSNYIELIEGHVLKGVESNYQKTTIDKLAQQFVKAMHVLYVSETPELKEELQKTVKEKDFIETNLQARVIVQQKMIEEMNERQKKDEERNRRVDALLAEIEKSKQQSLTA